MRDAPSLDIIPALQAAGAVIRAHDPEGMDHAKTMLPDVTFCTDAYDCAKAAEAVVIVTEWDAYRALDFKRLKNTVATPRIIDLRNIYRRSDIIRTGFEYYGIG
jgi:UDPglucose 6-dehydrogenase